ncbi:MAG: gliding motility lipoprotein GldB [Sinomicrobium sp.]|nr:gliding motility lipoprotein GldB [Sinomicrobium sp.]
MSRLWGLIILALWISCGKADRTEAEIAGIDIDLKVSRFDMAFANSSPDDLPELKKNYPYLFPERFPDSVWIARMQDSLQRELSAEVWKQFPGFDAPAAELRALFQHTAYYFPGFRPPKIITVTADVDYNNKVIYADSLLLIALDTYLGKDHYFYHGIPDYLKKNSTREQIAVDAASQIAQHYVPYPQERTFLAQMLFYGKLLYLKDLLIPSKTDPEKIGYTEDELLWAETNEAEVWRYFVERNLLFSTDLKLRERFTDAAPFSKFYLELDQESPGQIGRYIGWKIVKAYMKNNTVSLQQLLNAPAEAILNRSRFKPEK